MAQYTPNFNLYEPDSSDDFADFRTEFNNNMNIIDQNLGGGGGSGGHTIYDKDGNALAQESGLQFTGNVNVSDDSGNGRTVVDILGGGGAVYGAFIDTTRIIASGNIPQGSSTYTATEDCALLFTILSDSNNSAKIEIDGVKAWEQYDQNGINSFANFLLVRSGQTVTFTQSYSSNGNYKAYGLLQGTNGIFAPVIYSDNERVIGIWRDNKPLYQKTFLFHSTDSQGNYVFQDVSSLNIDSCVEIKGTCDRNVAGLGAIIYDMNSFESNQYQTYLGYSAFNGKIQYTIKLPVGETTTWQVITLRYTKTTDVAGSGNWNTDGVPTVHYSTSEQVVGTWINNKPLYEKTFEHSGALIVTDSFDNTIGTLSTVDQFISCEGYFRRTNANGLMYSLNGGTRPESGADTYKVTTRFYNGNVQVAVKGYSDIEYIALTVRYTKSTD